MAFVDLEKAFDRGAQRSCVGGRTASCRCLMNGLFKAIQAHLRWCNYGSQTEETEREKSSE